MKVYDRTKTTIYINCDCGNTIKFKIFEFEGKCFYCRAKIPVFKLREEYDELNPVQKHRGRPKNDEIKGTVEEKFLKKSGVKIEDNVPPEPEVQEPEEPEDKDTKDDPEISLEKDQSDAASDNDIKRRVEMTRERFLSTYPNLDQLVKRLKKRED